MSSQDILPGILKLLRIPFILYSPFTNLTEQIKNHALKAILITYPSYDLLKTYATPKRYYASKYMGP